MLSKAASKAASKSRGVAGMQNPKPSKKKLKTKDVDSGTYGEPKYCLSPPQALVRFYYGSIKALLRLYYGSLTALLRRY